MIFTVLNVLVVQTTKTYSIDLIQMYKPKPDNKKYKMPDTGL